MCTEREVVRESLMASQEDESDVNVAALMVEKMPEAVLDLGSSRTSSSILLAETTDRIATSGMSDREGDEEVERRPSSAGPRELPVNTPVVEERGEKTSRSNTPTRTPPKLTLKPSLRQPVVGKLDAQSIRVSSLIPSPPGGQTVKSISQSLPSTNLPGQFAKFSSLMNQLTKSPSSNGGRNAAGAAPGLSKSPSLTSSMSRARMQSPASSPGSNLSDSKPRPATPTRTGLKTSTSSSTTSLSSTPRPASPSRTSKTNVSSTSRPASPSRTSKTNVSSTFRPPSPSRTSITNLSSTNRPASPSRTSLTNVSSTNRPASPSRTSITNVSSANRPASPSRTPSKVLSSTPRPSSPSRVNLKSVTPTSLNSAVSRGSRPSSPSRSTTTPGSVNSTLNRGSRPASPARSTSSTPSTPVPRPSSPSAATRDGLSSNVTSGKTPTQNRPQLTSTSSVTPNVRPFTQGSTRSSSSASLTSSLNLGPRPITPISKLTTSTAPRSSTLTMSSPQPSISSTSTPPIRSAVPSPSSAKVAGSTPFLPANAATRPASPSRASATAKSVKSSSLTPVVSRPSSPSRTSLKPAKSPVSTATKVGAPNPITSTRQIRPSTATTLNLLNAKNTPSTPTWHSAKSSPGESPKSLGSSSGDHNSDVPSVSGSLAAGSVTAARKAGQEFQAQRLRIAGFKRSPGSPKASARIVPEGLPISPLALNAKKRCGWITSQSDGTHVAYHDEEWGVPIYDDKLLFELVVLEGAQAELSRPTILALRDKFRAAFSGFDPEVVARFDENKIAEMRADPSICIPEAKVRGSIDNARRVLEIVEEYGSLTKFLWSFVNYKPVISQYKLARQVPVKTPKSEALSKELVRRGFRFVGPTTMYSVMQAAGMVNDHLVTCFRHQEVTTAPTVPISECVKAKEEPVDLWSCVSMPEWKAPPVCEPVPRVEVLDMYFAEDRKVMVNSCEPVWAELPMIEETREEELEKNTADEDGLYDDGMGIRADCEIPVC